MLEKFLTVGDAVNAFMEILDIVLESPRGQEFLDRVSLTFGLPDLTPGTPAPIAQPPAVRSKGEQGTVSPNTQSPGIPIPMTPALAKAIAEAMPNSGVNVTNFVDENGNPRPPTHAEIVALKALKKGQ